ncbi:MAG: metal ABC transporter substrate-binding protein [Streptosporangiales bacterium]
MSKVVRVLLACALLVASAACSARGTNGAGGGSDGLDVVASFYPLEFAAKRVGGEHVHVTDLTQPGAEPHDLELTPQEVGTVAQADAVVYLSGFQPSVDGAIDNADSKARVDVAKYADLRAASGTARDPHFWLDPQRMRAVIKGIAHRLGAIDPDHAADYKQNAADLTTRLDRLDRVYRKGLRSCASNDLVTSHSAFGYLARRYGLHQVGVTGLSPEAEPGPQKLAQVTRYVRRHHVHTVYYETLVSPKVADTIASETGARTAVLDPIEGITKKSKGSNYLAVMRSNLDALRKGQQCR